MTVELLVMAIMMFGIGVQTIAGFGSALVAMPLLTQLIGIHTAAPMFALGALIAEGLMVVRYRLSLNRAAVWRLMTGSLIGIPIGIFSTGIVNERLLMIVLGCVTLGYGVYSLAGLQVMPLQDRRWGYGFGFLSGWLSGAFNTGGPPFVIYGTSQRWSPVEFKTNLQSVFAMNSITVIFAHALNGNITPEVLHFFILCVPAVLAGLAIGFYVERFISPAAFRRGVLMLLVVLGLSLIF